LTCLVVVIEVPLDNLTLCCGIGTVGSLVS
jgi:hypothetical protein